MARFGFGREMVDQTVASLSGGEKSRLVFAKISAANPQLIVMDEPTNHLDIESKDELFKQIQTFKGAIILVSHDWSLLETTVAGNAPSQLWVVDKGKVQANRSATLLSYQNSLLGNMDKNCRPLELGGTFFNSGSLTSSSPARMVEKLKP